MGRKSKTYTVKTSCSNCDYDGTVLLPRGMKVSDVLSKTDCPFCGCQTLSKTTFKVEKMTFPMTNPIIVPYSPPYDQPLTVPWADPFRVTCSDVSPENNLQKYISNRAVCLVN